MASILNPHKMRANWTLFQGLFFVAAFLAASATLVAVAGANPNDPSDGGILWLLALNMVLIATLTWIVFKQYQNVREASGHDGRSSLVRRFLTLFSIAAIVPAGIVAVFLGVTITRGINNWFSERVDTIVEETANVARATVDDYINSLETDARQAAADFNETVLSGVEVDFLTGQVRLGTFFAAYLIDSNGAIIAEAQGQSPGLFRRPSPAEMNEAAQGTLDPRLFERVGIATVILRGERASEEFLYFYRDFDPKQIAQLRTAEQALEDFRIAEDRSARLQWLFAIGYAEIVALILLLSWRFGIEAAVRLTGPIGRLATAADTVKDGDLTVRVPLPADRGELFQLSQTFNAMTEQLGEQRDALINAREDADDRRQFLETLLAEVSAGVIRTDGDLTITESNRSAEELLERPVERGVLLKEVNSELAGLAERTIRTRSSVDTMFEFSNGNETKYLRIKTALDPASGCVLTFDDTSSVVNAQRQLAWRDVARRIAHEIRNPLTPIQLSTERLRRRYSKKVNDEDGVFDRCLDTIQRQVSDIGRMVEEFSAFARMPKPSPSPFSLGDLLDRVGFAQNVVYPDLEISVEKLSEPETFMGDERLLGQAIGNLVKNAAQAISEDHSIEPEAGRISISIAYENGNSRIQIMDNGPGFPNEDRDRLLEPYVTTKTKGTGLGLAIVNRIIMDHGGSVSLKNRQDGARGAVVIVQLPDNLDIDGDAPLSQLDAKEKMKIEM